MFVQSLLNISLTRNKLVNQIWTQRSILFVKGNILKLKLKLLQVCGQGWYKDSTM